MRVDKCCLFRSIRSEVGLCKKSKEAKHERVWSCSIKPRSYSEYSSRLSPLLFLLPFHHKQEPAYLDCHRRLNYVQTAYVFCSTARHISYLGLWKIMPSVTQEQRTRMLTLAQEARNMSYSPYSKFRVGCAFLMKDGSYLQGCNVENAS